MVKGKKEEKLERMDPVLEVTGRTRGGESKKRRAGLDLKKEDHDKGRRNATERLT